MCLRPRNVKRKKVFVFSSFRIADPYLLLESPRPPPSPFLLGTLDFLSTCLGIDSQEAEYIKEEKGYKHNELS